MTKRLQWQNNGLSKMPTLLKLQLHNINWQMKTKVIDAIKFANQLTFI